MQKSVEKQQSVSNIERRIRVLKIIQNEQVLAKQDAIRIALIEVDYRAVKRSAKKKVKEWLKLLGSVLADIAHKELESIRSETAQYEADLLDDPAGPE